MLWIPVRLLLQPPLSSTNGLMNKMARTELMHGFSNTDGLPVTKADLATATAEHPICQQQGPAMNPQYGTIPQGDHTATWWQVDYIGPLPSCSVLFLLV